MRSLLGLSLFIAICCSFLSCGKTPISSVQIKKGYNSFLLAGERRNSEENVTVHVDIHQGFLEERMRFNRLNAPSTILHMFNYKFSDIEGHLKEISDLGFNAILISPPQVSLANYPAFETQWWAHYQPICYQIGGPLGTEEDLKRLIEKANELSIKIIADVVLNHMANPDLLNLKDGELYFPPEDLKAQCGNMPLFDKYDFHEKKLIEDYNDPQQVRDGWIPSSVGTINYSNSGLADLDQNSKKVFDAQSDYLKKLVKLGVKGFRFDAVKHMPSKYFNYLLHDEMFQDIYVFGEVLAHNMEEAYVYGEYLQNSPLDFMDLTHLAIVQRAFLTGQRLSHLSHRNDSHLLSFTENLVSNIIPTSPGQSRFVIAKITHDIPNNAIFHGALMGDSKDEALADAYQLGRSQGKVLITSEDKTVLATRAQDPVLSWLGRFGKRWQLFGDDSDTVAEQKEKAENRQLLKAKIAFRNKVNGLSQNEITSNIHNHFVELCLNAFTRDFFNGNNAISSGAKGLVVINKCGQDVEFSSVIHSKSLYFSVPATRFFPGIYRDEI
ncbi:MAG: hypothetical protein K2X39_06755, partial [Silvanigrellaceae bacterium]|nr:hypothetical protein [Silvanigrellaceae bacterium]